jgi:cyclopropane-fatty-acyl-phospholipid synthase
MQEVRTKYLIENILSPTGIRVNGNNPFDIQVKNKDFYDRVVHDGSMGLGESFMDGWWDCDDLTDFFCRIIPSHPERRVGKNLKLLSYILKLKMLNLNNRSRAYQVGEEHYDIGNELYRQMLDKRMVYSCAYWKDADNLDCAQEAKLNLICRKLQIAKGDRILDIGCGWGSFAKYAAERYEAEVVGITVSKEQVSLGKEICRGLPVEIRLQDYRTVNEPFDHIVSVGMFEHVGPKNYRAYMKTVHRCLRDGGLFLLHTIGKKRSNNLNDPWMDKYIFPNYWLPSQQEVNNAIRKLFVVKDWHAFGSFYDPTLLSWFHNFHANWDKLSLFYDNTFYRMWKYYLQSCAGAFRCGYLDVWQMVLSKKGIPVDYQAVR